MVKRGGWWIPCLHDHIIAQDIRSKFTLDDFSSYDWVAKPARSQTSISHLLSKAGPNLFADSLGHTHGCHSSGLRTTHHAIASIAILMQVLCQLGGLPAACLPNNNHDAVVPAEGSKYIKVTTQPGSNAFMWNRRYFKKKQWDRVWLVKGVVRK